jgi:hypothetical protein
LSRFKAAFFATLGYSQEDWAELERDLRVQHLVHEAEGIRSRYGKKFCIRAPLVGPNGRRAEAVTIWIVKTGERCPRFVTAHPGGG